MRRLAGWARRWIVFIVRKLGVPIAPPETCDALRREADDVVCAVTPEPFYAVGLWYEDFTQTTDNEVHDLLERARHELAPAPLPRR
jgi:putative phosphoribosyl transferase